MVLWVVGPKRAGQHLKYGRIASMDSQHTETRRCISIPCSRESTITVTTDDGSPVAPDAIDNALHAIGWREGLCPECTGLGPK
jgi:hypothetical protein